MDMRYQGFRDGGMGSFFTTDLAPCSFAGPRRERFGNFNHPTYLRRYVRSLVSSLCTCRKRIDRSLNYVYYLLRRPCAITQATLCSGAALKVHEGQRIKMEIK